MHVHDWGLFSVHVGDCREAMRGMPAGSAQMCVTSPPYFGLRDYGHAGQIGLEPTPAEYAAQMVGVFREVRRVLRDDGTLWLNLGDSYAGGGGGNYNKTGKMQAGGQHVTNVRNRPGWLEAAGVKSKNLIGIPWRVAFALQADGWYLRQDIIWHKPNPTPESVRDRCTKAHEYLFLLSKSERYYWNAEAMQEPAVGGLPGNNSHKYAAANEAGDEKHRTAAGLVAYAQRQRSKRAQAIPGQSVGTHRPDRDDSTYDTATRNRRSVWTVATRPFSGAHFATFPPALIEPCILAGSREGDTVLDPFGGAGTTALVATQHGRRAVLCELNPTYADLAVGRVSRALFGAAA